MIHFDLLCHSLWIGRALTANDFTARSGRTSRRDRLTLGADGGGQWCGDGVAWKPSLTRFPS
jgi:hypothetical protein